MDLKSTLSGFKNLGFIASLVLILSLNVGCAALGGYVTDIAKDQGMKVLASQMDKLEARLESETNEAELDIDKLEKAAQELTMLFKGGLPDGQNAFTVLTNNMDAIKNSQGETEGKGILLIIIYMLKQGLWGFLDRKRDDKIVVKANGNGNGNAST